MNTKMKEVQLSVADYGMTPAGSASANKTAWDNAVAAAKAADADLWVPAGTYAITSMVLDKQVNVRGPGRNVCIIRPTTTTTHGLTIKQDTEFDSATVIEMKGIQFYYNGAGQPSGYHGAFIQAKVIMDGCYFRGFTYDGMHFAPNDANVATGDKGTIGNAAFFSIIRNCWSRYNGRYGVFMRMGANVTQFEYGSWSNNGSHGFYHYNDSPDDNGATGSTYGTVIIGGQASYNTGVGYYFESGTNITSYGTYAEYNGSSNNTTANGYDTQPYDYYFGNNIVRTFFVIGVLLNADTGKVRLPPESNTTCMVLEGGRPLSVTIPKRAASQSNFTGTTVTDLRSELNTFLGKLRTANIIDS
jgi:hypothetical protein